MTYALTIDVPSPPSWANTFNTSWAHWDTIAEAAGFAAKAGYAYLSWRGDVYYLSNQGDWVLTHLTVQSLGR